MFFKFDFFKIAIGMLSVIQTKCVYRILNLSSRHFSFFIFCSVESFDYSIRIFYEKSKLIRLKESFEMCNGYKSFKL